MDSKNSNDRFAIVDVTVINIYNGEKNVKDIIIEDERIASMNEPGTANIPPEIRVIDGGGKYAIPGLWDAHVHMTVWPEFTDRISALFIANGITCVRDMGGRLEDVLDFRQQCNQPGVAAPRVWMAGPIVDGTPRITDGGEHGPDMAVEVNTPEEAIDLVDTLVEKGIDFIKPYEMLRPEVFKALVQRTQQHHHLPACGHLPIRMTIPEVLDVGPYDIQHLGGICAGMKYDCTINSRQLSADRTAILDSCSGGERGVDVLMKVINATELTPEEQDSDKIDALIQLFVEKGTWHTPTLVTKVGFRELGFDDDPFLTETLSYLPGFRQDNALAIRESTDDPVKLDSFRQWNLKIVGQMHDAGVKFLSGTDCPAYPGFTPGFCLHLELKAMVLAGLSPLEALQTATINPAEFFSITDQLGSIEVGKFADMVLLDSDPLMDIDNTRRIASVVSRGKYYDRQSLDKMLEEVIEE